MEKTCLDCSAYVPIPPGEWTDFGICLNDDAFESCFEDLLQDVIPPSCREIVERKRFIGDRPACPDFSELEQIEIDEESSLGRKLRQTAEQGELTPERVEALLLQEMTDRVDWTSIPLDRHVLQLQSNRPEERNTAISSLGGLIALGNPEAFKALLDFLSRLPAPARIDEVHLRVEILRQLNVPKRREAVVQTLVEELYKIPSNNMTRQYIAEIFRTLGFCPLEAIQDPLEKMLIQKRFSYKFKKKIEQTLDQSFQLSRSR